MILAMMSRAGDESIPWMRETTPEYERSTDPLIVEHREAMRQIRAKYAAREASNEMYHRLWPFIIRMANEVREQGHMPEDWGTQLMELCRAHHPEGD